MKNIRIYKSERYQDNLHFLKIKENIYRTYNTELDRPVYVTSLMFEQEPGFGEGNSPKEISQYPMEDVLDEFFVFVNNPYTEQNKQSEKDCYIEFGSEFLENIQDLLSIVGKHVYNKGTDHGYAELKIEK